MMQFIRWLIAIPFIVAAVLFALAHRQSVDFHWSPFHDPVTVPLYLLTLGLTAGGFVLGAVATWIGTGGLRRDNRQQKKTVRMLEKELVEANERIIKMQDARRADTAAEQVKLDYYD